MGVNQSHQATRTAQAIINLALMTGNLGRPGTGANSITGQCNAMGSRLFSNTTNLLGGHDFANPRHREKVARATGIPVACIPDRPSLAYDQILQTAEEGRIRALWFIATNPSHSWIDQDRINRLLDRLDFVVVQDMYCSTETAHRAHLVLPAAGWGEKEGCFINSERRIGYSPKVRRAPGQALADFHIFRLIASYWGCTDLFREWTHPEAVFRILQRCTEGQPCDITGITGYHMLRRSGGVQWPLPRDTATPARERRLFEDGSFFTPDRRARFVFDPPAAPPRTPLPRLPADPAHRSRHQRPVAHGNPHSQVGGTAQTGTRRYPTRHPPRRCPPPRTARRRPRDHYLASRHNRTAHLPDRNRRPRPGLPAHARRPGQPPHPQPRRPAQPPALLQVLRRARARPRLKLAIRASVITSRKAPPLSIDGWASPAILYSGRISVILEIPLAIPCPTALLGSPP